MKVEAYVCDACNTIKEEHGIAGIQPVADLFDNLLSYPFITNPKKTNVHCCTDCYRERCTVPASNTVNRKKDEPGYKMVLKELTFALRQLCVQNVLRKIHGERMVKKT